MDKPDLTLLRKYLVPIGAFALDNEWYWDLGSGEEPIELIQKKIRKYAELETKFENIRALFNYSNWIIKGIILTEEWEVGKDLARYSRSVNALKNRLNDSNFSFEIKNLFQSKTKSKDTYSKEFQRKLRRHLNNLVEEATKRRKKTYGKQYSEKAVATKGHFKMKVMAHLTQLIANYLVKELEFPVRRALNVVKDIFDIVNSGIESDTLYDFDLWEKINDQGKYLDKLYYSET